MYKKFYREKLTMSEARKFRKISFKEEIEYLADYLECLILERSEDLGSQLRKIPELSGDGGYAHNDPAHGKYGFNAPAFAELYTCIRHMTIGDVKNRLLLAYIPNVQGDGTFALNRFVSNLYGFITTAHESIEIKGTVVVQYIPDKNLKLDVGIVKNFLYELNAFQIAVKEGICK